MQKTLLFDLDGTLTDPALGITQSVAYALERFGIQVEDRRTLFPYIGPPLLESFMRFHHLTDAQAVQAIQFYREYFGVKGLFENEVYPGMESFLQRMRDRGFRLSVATSKPEVYARQILEHFALNRYFEAVFGTALDEERQTKAVVIARAVETLGLKGYEADCRMIGDRLHDVQGARACGIDTVGVLYGYGSREELEQAGAAAIVKDLPELENYLVRWAESR